MMTVFSLVLQMAPAVVLWMASRALLRLDPHWAHRVARGLFILVLLMDVARIAIALSSGVSWFSEAEDFISVHQTLVTAANVLFLAGIGCFTWRLIGMARCGCQLRPPDYQGV